jgi:predicted ATPase
MITYIKINGFKSFYNFEMEFTPFTVIAGTNASGKSNLFDALKLLSNLAEADKIHSAFKDQRGEMIELFTQFDENSYSNIMEFTVEMLVDKTIKDSWGNIETLKYTRLRYELKIRRFTNEYGIEDLEVFYERLVNLKHNEDKWIKIIQKNNIEKWRPKVVTGKRGIPYIDTEMIENIPTVVVPQDSKGGNRRNFPLKRATRTVLSSFDSVDFKHILAVKEEMKKWRFIQLNPEDLRQPTSKMTGDDIISSSGKNLAAALYRIQQLDPYYLVEISRKLNLFLPEFIEISVIDDKENKQYVLVMKGGDGKEYSSRVLSEGTLRILALCIMEYDERFSGLVCFEEPENGIHPFRIEAMAELLRDLTTGFDNPEMQLRQLIVNTHSPIFVKEMIKWCNDRNVSVHLSVMKTVITSYENKRVKFNITKITPSSKDTQYFLKYSEIELKISLSTIEEYLSTANMDKYKI